MNIIAHADTPQGRGRVRALLAALNAQAIAITAEQEQRLMAAIGEDNDIIVVDSLDDMQAALDGRSAKLVVYDEVTPAPEPTTWLGLAQEVSGWQPRPATPPRPERVTALYRGHLGRGKVTWTDDGDVIVSRLKSNGAWKQVARHPWNRGNDDFKTNAALQAICGPDFIKED